MNQVNCRVSPAFYIRVIGAAITKGAANRARVLISSPINVFNPDRVAAHASINIALDAYLCTFR